jgi:hypothetical protein
VATLTRSDIFGTSFARRVSRSSIAQKDSEGTILSSLERRASGNRPADLPRVHRAGKGISWHSESSEPGRYPLTPRRPVVHQHPVEVERRNHPRHPQKPRLSRGLGLEQEDIREIPPG